MAGQIPWVVRPLEPSLRMDHFWLSCPLTVRKLPALSDLDWTLSHHLILTLLLVSGNVHPSPGPSISQKSSISPVPFGLVGSNWYLFRAPDIISGCVYDVLCALSIAHVPGYILLVLGFSNHMVSSKSCLGHLTTTLCQIKASFQKLLLTVFWDPCLWTLCIEAPANLQLLNLPICCFPRHWIQHFPRGLTLLSQVILILQCIFFESSKSKLRHNSQHTALILLSCYMW